MDQLVDSLISIQQRLDSCGVRSATIGALAVAVWGRGRTTNDVDLKLNMTREQSSVLLASLQASPAYTMLMPDPLKALETVGFVFVSDPAGTRIDLLLTDTGFDEHAIGRSVEVEMSPGKTARVVTAEDLIIYKLISTRSRDHDDAANVIQRQGARLDRGYVCHWLRQFELALDDSTLVSTFQRMLVPNSCSGAAGAGTDVGDHVGPA